MASTKTCYFTRDNKPGKTFARIIYLVGTKRKQAIRVVRDVDGFPSDAAKDIERTVRELRNEYDQDGERAFVKERITANDFFDEWLAAVKPIRRERTYEDYEENLNRYVRPVIGHLQVEKLGVNVKGGVEHLQAVINRMMDAKLGGRTIEYARTIMSKAFKYAVYPRQLLKENPVKHVSIPPKQEREYQWFDSNSVTRFLKTLDADPDGLLLEFALFTGMRPQEFLAVQWSDFDWERGIVKIKRTLYRKRKKAQLGDTEPRWRFEETKTRKSKRDVTLDAILIQKLKRHQIEQDEKRRKAKKWETRDTEGKEMRLVFCTPIGTPHNLSNVHRRIFKPILEKAKLPDMRLYDLRHSFASLLYEKKEESKVISELMGHSSTTVTENIYLHINRARKHKATNKLSQLRGVKK